MSIPTCMVPTNCTMPAHCARLLLHGKGHQPAQLVHGAHVYNELVKNGGRVDMIPQLAPMDMRGSRVVRIPQLAPMDMEAGSV